MHQYSEMDDDYIYVVVTIWQWDCLRKAWKHKAVHMQTQERILESWSLSAALKPWECIQIITPTIVTFGTLATVQQSLFCQTPKKHITFSREDKSLT